MRTTYLSIAALLVLFLQSPLFSQESYHYLDSLNKAFPEQKVILYDSQEDYTIKIRKKDLTLDIIELVDDQYLALEESSVAYVRRYYNNYSDLVYHAVLGSGQFSRYNSQICGNIEVDGIFYDDAKACDFKLSFKKRGEYLTLKTTKLYNDPKYLTRIGFYNPYGVSSKTVKLHIPDEVDCELIEMNFDRYDVEKNITYNQKKGIKTIEYHIKNIPAYLELDNMPDYSCTFPYILVLFKSFDLNGEKIQLIENLDDLYKWYHTLTRSADISAELKQRSRQVCGNRENDTARIAAVYAFVQDKIRYLAFLDGYAAFVPDSPDNVYKKKYGDCKGMANLCKAMLVYLGYDARLAWVYSGHTCLPDSLPSIASANHLICAVKLNGSFIYLDPTSKYTSLFELNNGIQGKDCIIENGDSYVIGHIPSMTSEDNRRSIHSACEILGDNMHIKGEINMTGAEKSLFLHFATSLPAEDRSEFLEFFITTGNNNYSINEYASSGIEYKMKNFIITYDLQLDNNIINLGDEIIFTPDLHNELLDYTIDTNRSYPFAFHVIEEYHDFHSFRIPDDYLVHSVPDTMHIVHPKYEFYTGFEVQDSILQYTKRISIKDHILEADEFEDWNAAIAKLSNFYRQVVILKSR